MDKWRQSYSKLVADVMLPNWVSAIESAHDQFRERSNGLYDPGYDTMMKWTREHAANWVVDITKDQRLAINGLIQRATQLEFQTSDALCESHPSYHRLISWAGNGKLQLLSKSERYPVRE